MPYDNIEVPVDKSRTELANGGSWHKLKGLKIGKEIIVNDVIAGNSLKKFLIKLSECDVVATLNLNNVAVINHIGRSL